ncbi:ABC transporter substrate-binding protein [Nitratireductor rhodophyticola]|uniref:ABC transporter substrate-binding protein n=1 Tax=Nitratireductor rhodophyticola TaxID=2854036 RepID=UPI00300BB197
MTKTRKLLLAAAWSSAMVAFGHAQEPVKIGMITTLSGPAGYLGQDIRDGFALAIEENGGTLGGVPVELHVEDDGLKPGNARQIAEKMLADDVKLFTGIVFANVAFATVPEILDNDALYVAANTASSSFAGEECHANYFVSSWQDDSQGESAGALAQSLGYKTAFLVAPNYQAGKETMVAFKRFFEGEVVGEIYTGLDQTDFAAEMAQIRAAAPDMVYEFQPGGLGIAFIRQYQQAGLSEQIPLVVHPASMDHVILGAVGEAADGLQVTSHWNDDFDNPTNASFIEAWRAKYDDRPVTYYAAQGYDAALMIAAGLAGSEGSVEDIKAFREALLSQKIESVRGVFSLGPNQHPVQDWYALKAVKNDTGQMVLKTEAKVLSAHQDGYAQDCTLQSAD